jgi:hypothetical protein
MSKLNGDKARHDRIRKKRLRNRFRMRALKQALLEGNSEKTGGETQQKSE